MNEHMRVGHEYPTIRQALAYSFGLDSQEFVVAYETDDLVAFGDLVRALRSTESRRSTVSDTPILLGIHRPIDEILALLGARADGAVTADRLADAALVERAEGLFPGGVNSPVRAFRLGRPAAARPRARRGRVRLGRRRPALHRLHRRLGPGDPRSRPSGGRRRDRDARSGTAWRSARPTRSRSSWARRSARRCRRWSACGSRRRAPRRS